MQTPTLLLIAFLVPLLGACSTVPQAPRCNESAYRSLNPAHYEPVKQSTRTDVPFLLHDA